MGAPACYGCAHFGYNGLEPAESCNRPLTDRRDLVTDDFADRLCADPWRERSGDRTFFGKRIKCGPRGKFFTPKPEAIRPVCKECGR